MMDEFEDIRPYRDDEVEAVVKNLYQQDELILGMAKFRFPKLFESSPIIAKSLVRAFVKKKAKSIKTILDIQHIVGEELTKILAKTAGKITTSGLGQLSKEKSYLFIGNHRDISMDPALVSYLLHNANHNTVEIAIGDNLLKKQYISDLMKLNKSFIVKTSLIGREKETEQLLKHLNERKQIIVFGLLKKKVVQKMVLILLSLQLLKCFI